MTEKHSFILRDRAIQTRALAYLREIAIDPDHPVEALFREYRKNRSLEANDFYWGFVVTPMANHLGYTPQEMHMVLLCEVFGVKMIRGIDGVNLLVPRRTTTSPDKMKVGEFSDYITHCIRIAAEQHIPIDTRERPDVRKKKAVEKSAVS